MSIADDASELLSYIERVHSRTGRVATLIPVSAAEHNFGAGRFTPAGLVRHLAGIKRYMFVEIATGGTNRYPGHGSELASGMEQVLAYQRRLHEESMRMLSSLTPAGLVRRCETPAGATLAVWKWLRLMTEHEAHHRGQLYWMLADLGVRTPPLFGLTSEEIRDSAANGIRNAKHKSLV